MNNIITIRMKIIILALILSEKENNKHQYSI